MKKTNYWWIVFLLCFVNVYGNSKRGDSIDYGHKLISKEISRTFKTESYALQKINPDDTTGDSDSDHGKGSYFSISNNISQLGYCYIGRVNSCRAGGCSISPDLVVNEDYEYFDYVVVFDSTYTVSGIRVFNYQATHGQEICSRNWLKQYIGFQGNSQLKIGKDIDAISGATISVYAITLEIERVSLHLRKTLALCAK